MLLSIDDACKSDIGWPAEIILAKLVKLIYIAILVEIHSDSDIITISLALRTGKNEDQNK